MEPFAKRQRLYSPIGPSFPQSFDSEDAYYDDDDFIVDEEEEDIEEPPPDLDPESDFHQKRAKLDYKLKSTFEAIFEKYGKNFDGVGDEIDLATGEIVVNNGHILEMLDERDAGDVDGAQSVPTELTDESGEIPSIEEISDSDEDDGEASGDVSDGEALEDDLILRGFALANRFSKPSPELGSLRNPPRPSIRPPTSHRQLPVPAAKIQNPGLPSQAEIITRFGPELGPQIAEYVSKQSVPKDKVRESLWRAPEIPAFKSRDNNIESAWRTPEIPAFKSRDNAVEPAWRAPDIPAFKPKRQEVRQSVAPPPQLEPSPSPEEATSIWALPQKRGRKKKPSVGSFAHMGGESSRIRQREEHSLDPAGYSASTDGDRQASPARKKRRKFTEEDDQILLDWVNRAKQQGVALNYPTWKKLEAMHPHHSWSSWEYRYKHHFTYLVSNLTEESEVSVDEPSIDSMFVAPKSVPAHRTDMLLDAFEQDTPRVRPNRIRKPAQKDSRIISWSEAVDVLESLDPELHAGLMQDVATTENGISNFNQSHMSPKKQLPRPANNIQPPKYESTPCPPISPPREIIDLTDDNDVGPSPEQYSIPGAPCPHADCKLQPTITYRLQRRDNEELSEMCLHLFLIHHTTPYPCGEIGCPRQLDQGFFMQAELVSHVRKKHPTIGALHRLRGRVDSELLDRNIELAASPNDPNSLSNRPVSQGRDSDFMSPRKFAGRRTSSSKQHSSSELDQTPRASTTIPGMARSTPMTSVSSMRVHHPSAVKVSIEEEEEDSNLHYMKYIDDMSMRAQRSSVVVSNRLSLNSSQPPAPKVLPSLKGKEKPIGASNSLPTPMTATRSFSDSGLSFFDDISRQQRPPVQQQQQSARPQVEPEVDEPASTIAETPDPAPPQVQEEARTIPSTSSPMQISPVRKQSNVPRNVQRNVLDPSYEFSDEEPGPAPIKAPETQPPSSSTLPKHSAVMSSMGPPPAIQYSGATDIPLKPRSKKLKRIMSSASRISFATPKAQRAAQQSLLRMALDTDDFDELSLDKDDVVLLSSQPRLTPFSSADTIKKEEGAMNTPRPLASTVSKKRTYSTFRDASSPDELAAEDLSPSARRVGTSQPEIKAEHETSLPKLPHPRGVQHFGIPSSQMTPSSTNRRMPIRTGTPLINLTPTQSAQAATEIIGSTAGDSSPALPSHPPQRPRNKRQKQAPTSKSSSPLADLLTPTRRPAGNLDLLKAEEVTVVVKTPGGTYRRCGEDEFMCGRSFCFRCGSGSGSGVRIGA